MRGGERGWGGETIAPTGIDPAGDQRLVCGSQDSQAVSSMAAGTPLVWSCVPHQVQRPGLALTVGTWTRRALVHGDHGPLCLLNHRDTSRMSGDRVASPQPNFCGLNSASIT